MYNEIILSKLNNLKYLTTIKKSNVTATSKKNNYNDIVKFYAQINKDDVIQKISFKATGCTYFLVFCDYFCELVEGKTIKNALKIDGEKLETLIELSDNRKHVLEVILNTFALLIKKYRKGVEKGIIIPCEVEEVKEDKKVEKKVNKSTEIANKKETKSNNNSNKPTEITPQKKNTKKSTSKNADIEIKTSVNKTKKDVENKEKLTNAEISNKTEKSKKQASNIQALQSMINSSKKTKNEEKTEETEIKVEEVSEKATRGVVKNSNTNVEVDNTKKKGLLSWFRKNK